MGQHKNNTEIMIERELQGAEGLTNTDDRCIKCGEKRAWVKYRTLKSGEKVVDVSDTNGTLFCYKHYVENQKKKRAFVNARMACDSCKNELRLHPTSKYCAKCRKNPRKGPSFFTPVIKEMKSGISQLQIPV